MYYDIYYAFIYKSIELLDDDGVLVMITPTSYLTNKSSLNLLLRHFLKNLLRS